jgi:hypothetical protein
VLPYAQRGSGHGAGHRTVGGFDFFGTQRPAPGDEQGREHGRDDHGRDDHGSDAAGTHERGRSGDTAKAAPHAADAEVIDLTAHDDTEQLDVTELRAKA